MPLDERDKTTPSNASLENGSEKPTVKVVLRLAPRDNSLQAQPTSISQELLPNGQTGCLAFDRVFPGSATQKELNDYFVPSIDKFKAGTNVSFIAYGHSGTGKSYTMGNTSRNGLIQMAASMILPGAVAVSYVQVYNDKLRDLLGETGKPRQCQQPAARSGSKSEDNLSFRSSELAVDKLSWRAVSSIAEFELLLDTGNKRRHINEIMESDLARAHAILIFESKETRARLVMVDMAGSSVGIPPCSGSVNKCNIAINMSMSALVKVVSQLSQGAKHVSYRDSKLTRLLQPSTDNPIEVNLIACIPDEPELSKETIRILLYAYVTRTPRVYTLEDEVSRARLMRLLSSSPLLPSKSKPASAVTGQAIHAMRQLHLGPPKPAHGSFNHRPLALENPKTVTREPPKQNISRRPAEKSLHEQLMKQKMGALLRRGNYRVDTSEILAELKPVRPKVHWSAFRLIILILIVWLCFAPI